MSEFYTSDNSHIMQAYSEAQKLAFAPVMFQVARSMRDLNILKVLLEAKNAGLSANEISKNCNLSLYGTKVLCDAGLSCGLVYKKKENYVLTKTGFLVQTDRMTRINMDFIHDVCYKGLFSLEESVKKGTPEGLRVFGGWKTVYEGLSNLPEKAQKSWFDFDHYYSDEVFPSAMPILFEKSVGKLLDVGGNTGKFALQCTAYNPDVKVTILDHPGQLALAKEKILDAGYMNRINMVAIDLLNHSVAYPKGYDAVWMSQFLDCFGEEDILQLLIKAKAALNSTGRIYINEPFWDRQRFEQSAFALNMTSIYFTAIANGNSRMYDSADFFKLIELAGLEVEQIIDNVGISHTILICKKKGE